MVVFLSLAGHAAGRGAVPSAGGILLAVILASGLTFAVTRQRHSFQWLLAFLLMAQLLIHAVLVVSHTHAMAGDGAMPLVPTGSTAVAHVVASVVAAIVLAYGEVIVAGWIRLCSTALAIWVTRTAPPVEGARPVEGREPWSVIDADHVWDVARRGPPVVIAA